MATIERNARALAQLVTDLLDATRIASGKVQLEADPVDDEGRATTASADPVRFDLDARCDERDDR